MLDLHVLRMWMIIQRNISPVVVVAVFLLLFFSRSETALCLLSAALSYFNGAKATGGLPQISFDKDLRLYFRYTNHMEGVKNLLLKLQLYIFIYKSFYLNVFIYLFY